MKDNFSSSSDKYAKFRPDYPQAIFEFLYPLLENKAVAWDCATGNGQIAKELAKEFNLVEASDISKEQIKHAYQSDNINYSLQAAEKTNYLDNSFDLITVGQAVHWFDFDEFNAEVKRVGKPSSILALIGYELIQISPEIDAIIAHFYKNIIGEFWDPERRHIENSYQQIPFPFQEIQTPEIKNIKDWSYDNLIGYLNTWSAVKHYMTKNNTNPIELIEKDLKKAWGNIENRKAIFPIIFRAGRIK